MARVEEEAKVNTATMYLDDDTLLWWRRQHSDIEKGLCMIDTWDGFKRGFFFITSIELKLQLCQRMWNI